MEQIKVEVGQYKQIDKGSLKGSFSLVIYPMGQKILGCKYFELGDRKWFNFPQLEIKKEGLKTEYIPYISYLTKEYRDKLNEAVLSALKLFIPANLNEETNPSPVQSDASQLWF